MTCLLTRADARHLPFADGSVQCCVTSPPYFALRDYGVAGQIGLETTPDAYVQTMVAVFREVRRVLRDDGTCWLNLGDSYANDDKWGGSTGGKHVAALHGDTSIGRSRRSTGLKPKDLCMIPARVALALQVDGWYLRSDIIWSKPNPMPESVTDRPTKAHEYVFLLTKSERYFYDADAVREPYAMTSWTAEADAAGSTVRGQLGMRSGDKGAARADGAADGTRYGATSMMNAYGNGGRNLRSVWTIATKPYPGSHFATMPEKLAERCILAGSKAGDIVLDPFMGSGTVARVSLRLGRRAVGCDLNLAYIDLQRERTRVTYGLPLDGDAA